MNYVLFQIAMMFKHRKGKIKNEKLILFIVYVRNHSKQKNKQEKNNKTWELIFFRLSYYSKLFICQLLLLLSLFILKVLLNFSRSANVRMLSSIQDSLYSASSIGLTIFFYYCTLTPNNVTFNYYFFQKGKIIMVWSYSKE